jgi:3-hydroxyacyl-[acyl-carrier-protein] dehydratase
LLLHELYTIRSLTATEDFIQTSVALQPNHPIFHGHFPGQPVLPGVCMMEMIVEITGEHFKKKFRIKGGPLVKFLRMIDPEKTPIVNLEIKCHSVESALAVQGRIYVDMDIFMKFQLDLISDPV